MKCHELENALGFSGKRQHCEFQHALHTMKAAGKVVCLSKSRWGLPDLPCLVVGVIRMMPGGGGILIPEADDAGEYFIGARSTGVALPNDTVAIEICHAGCPVRRSARNSGETQRAQGRVTRVIERANEQVVGLIRHANGYSYVVPDNPAFKHNVRVSDARKIGKNHKVLVHLNDWTDPFKPLTGSILEDLGEQSAPGVDTDSLLREAGIQEIFPEEVVDEVGSLSSEIPPEMFAGRRDLRHTVTFTIDPAAARDYDDAVSLEPHPEGGWLLGVHIADVSAYVKPGSHTDHEAYKRGNSIYLVDRVVMMLPTELTTQVCSLNPHQDHLTHSVFIHLGANGERLAGETFPSVIHSKARLTYNQVQCFIDGKGGHGIPGAVARRLVNLHPLVKMVRARRVSEGSLEINTPEVDIKLDGSGKVESMELRASSKDAYQLIEDCMLLANRAVAEKLMASATPAIYRIHEEPDEEQWNKIAMELNVLGIPVLPRTRKALNEMFRLVAGTPAEYTALLAVLRNFKRAEYTARQIGHFGLAFENYTHFTSPIRRYPDLLVHRILKSVERGEFPALSRARMEEVAAHCTETEKRADDLERKSVEKKRLAYYSRLIRKAPTATFEGQVVGIKRRGVIVELPDTLQRGMIPFSSITDEWLEPSGNLTKAQTGDGKVRFTLGDKLAVVLKKVDTARSLIDFAIAEPKYKNIRKRGCPR